MSDQSDQSAFAARDVVLCECFARDGLQHESRFIDTPTKIALIDGFAEAGLSRIEATSYSHPTHVPAFADASDVLAGITPVKGHQYKATCPNPKAIERALRDIEAGSGATELSLLVSATEAHSMRNLRSSRSEQWNKIASMSTAARGKARLIGVISMAFGCPFEGRVDPARVAECAARFADMGVELVTLGDTIGTATPKSVREVFSHVQREAPGIVPVAHFHDTRGTGIANCLAALDVGCTHFDSAMGGVGGHPTKIRYGDGFTGNVATEDLVNILEELGIETGVDLDRILAMSRRCETVLGRELRSMVARSGFGLENWGYGDVHG